MLINKINKTFQTRSDKPDSNWLNDDNYIVIPDNSPLANKIMQYFPRFDFILDENNNLIDVVEISKTEEELNQERIEEIKSKLNQLDITINRATEDLYVLTNTTPYTTVQETITNKEELRKELQNLTKVGE
jgi:hypothetical protein